MTKLKSLHIALAAGSLAIMVSGCGTMERSGDRSAASDRSSDRAGSRGSTASSSTPASIDPFSRDYVSFPASANESAGNSGLSFYCQQHYDQPGCQTTGEAMNRR